MAKFIFESVTKRKAPAMSDAKEIDFETAKDDEKEHAGNKRQNVAVELKADDEENDLSEEKEEKRDDQNVLPVDQHIFDEFEKEYQKDENHLKLIWGPGKGHLWFFEHDLWRNIIFQILFFEQANE